MKTSLESAPVVAIASMADGPVKPRSSIYTRYAPLAQKLTTLGVQVVRLNGAHDRLSDDGTDFGVSYRFTPDGFVADDEPITVHAARDLTGGIARYTSVPALNPEALRNATSSKLAQHRILSLALADFLPETHAISTAQDLPEILASLPGDRVVIKADGGRKSRGMLLGTKGQVLADARAHMDVNTTYLAQEFIPDLHEDFAEGIIVHEADKAKLEHLGGPREIRVHVIDSGAFLVHGRVGESGKVGMVNSQWVMFDPNTVPNHVISLAQQCASILRTATKAKNSYIAVDLSPDGKKILEVNGRNPAAIKPNSMGSDQPHQAWVSNLSLKLGAMAWASHTESRS